MATGTLNTPLFADKLPSALIAQIDATTSDANGIAMVIVSYTPWPCVVRVIKWKCGASALLMLATSFYQDTKPLAKSFCVLSVETRTHLFAGGT